MIDKDKILLGASNHVGMIINELKKSRSNMEKLFKKSKESYKTLTSSDKIVEDRLMQRNRSRVGEMGFLENSPYFVRCDVIWENDEKKNNIRSLYFGKFSFDEHDIYSWITPASSMRFEEPGDVEYLRPDGKIQKARLVRKDQFMIVNGEIKFLSTESVNNPRELVYQDHFSGRKTGFVLPEIVAQMEKAQDQVIRAHHIGPFMISGPAGSGKTTLALHRVAYLMQSPDLENVYTSDSVVVFVQDEGTKEYFSHLLPELGIDSVKIITFNEWAFSVLDLNLDYSMRYGDSDKDMDLYEFSKIRALRTSKVEGYNKRSVYSILESTYNACFNDEQKSIFKRQRKEKVLDKIDLILLLRSYIQAKGSLGSLGDYWVELNNGTERKKKGFIPFNYSLMVVDEFQNYLPEQLELMRSCLNKRSQSILYVGDMAQQVHIGTVRDLDEINEDIDNDRMVKLSKVYRNTKAIFRYIRNLGYSIEIPESLKEGCDVGEYVCSSPDKEIKVIENVLGGREFLSVGVLAKNSQYLEPFKKIFSSNEKVHIMTMNEAQGVEFDIVFLVGMDEDTFKNPFDENVLSSLRDEKSRINRDILYIALTRAMSELHIMGRKHLREIV